MTANVDDPEAAVERRLEIARSAGVPEEPLRQWAQARRGQSFGIAGIVAPARDAAAGRGRGDRPRGVGGRADPGPRAVARVPVAARAAAADLGRPSARARLALLRLRLLARPGRRVPGLAGSRRGARRAAVPARATGARSATSRVTSPPTASSIGRRLAALEDVLREDGAVTAFDAVPRVFGEAMTPMNANWWLSETLCYLRHLQVTGRAAGRRREPGALAARRPLGVGRHRTASPRGVEASRRLRSRLRVAPSSQSPQAPTASACGRSAAQRPPSTRYAPRSAHLCAAQRRRRGADGSAAATAVVGRRGGRAAAGAAAGSAVVGVAAGVGVDVVLLAPARLGRRRRPLRRRGFFAGAFGDGLRRPSTGAAADGVAAPGPRRARPRAPPRSARARPCARPPCAPPASCARAGWSRQAPAVQEQQAGQQQAGEGEHHRAARAGRARARRPGGGARGRRDRRRAGASPRGWPSARAGTKLRTRTSKASVHARPRRTSHCTPVEGRWAGHQSRKTPAARPAAMHLG